MAYIGRQQTSSAFLKLDDLSSQFNNSTTTFTLTVGGESYYPGNPFTLLVSLGGVIQEPVASFTVTENQITFASAPTSGANFFCVVLSTTLNTEPLKTLTVGARSGAQTLDLHGRTLSIADRSGTKHTIGFNLT
ncbi:MAG: hypothetical protein VXY93_12705 [Pseudomonadota bacterium]|nr:hypothetical protein [Pseudomonadota bacterium]